MVVVELALETTFVSFAIHFSKFGIYNNFFDVTKKVILNISK